MNCSDMTRKKSWQYIFYGTLFALLIFMCNNSYSAEEDLIQVKGSGEYTYGDNERPNDAKVKALLSAKCAAIQNCIVYVDSSTEVKNFSIIEDNVTSMSVGYLQSLLVTKEGWKDEGKRTYYVEVKALANRKEIMKFIEKKIKEQERKKSKNGLIPPLKGRPEFPSPVPQ